jgi:hypothetical protein
MVEIWQALSRRCVKFGTGNLRRNGPMTLLGIPKNQGFVDRGIINDRKKSFPTSPPYAASGHDIRRSRNPYAA